MDRKMKMIPETRAVKTKAAMIQCQLMNFEEILLVCMTSETNRGFSPMIPDDALSSMVDLISSSLTWNKERSVLFQGKWVMALSSLREKSEMRVWFFSEREQEGSMKSSLMPTEMCLGIDDELEQSRKAVYISIE